MDYQIILDKIKSKFTKAQIKIFESISAFESLHLASMGHNDTEGYQVFTPRFIVEDMCSAVGDEIFDFSKRVLEPTSGDGAFTTYIYQKRLEKISNNFEIESLKALSTIYSIEMDKELIEIQRNNIFTLTKLFVEEKNINVNPLYFELLKCVITMNFMWAMFNTDQSDGMLLGIDVAYKMPEAEKGNFKRIDMPVWIIDENAIDFHEEGVDVW